MTTLMALAFALQLGYLPNGGVIGQPMATISPTPIEQSVYADMSTRVILAEHVFVGIGVVTKSYVEPKDWTNVNPFIQSYRLEAGMTFGGFQVGWEHHPSIQAPGEMVPSRSYDNVFVRFEGRAPIIQLH